MAIEKQFAAGKFETTFEEWDACVLAGTCKHSPNDQGWGRGRRPVTNVSWEDAKEYVAWLSKKTGLKYRLLTETEWEYAARAGTNTPFSTGKTITSDEANFDGGYTYGGSEKGQYRKSTVGVGSFRPNDFDLYDYFGHHGYHARALRRPERGDLFITHNQPWFAAMPENARFNRAQS